MGNMLMRDFSVELSVGTVCQSARREEGETSLIIEVVSAIGSMTYYTVLNVDDPT
jgi:hypothetical protein